MERTEAAHQPPSRANHFRLGLASTVQVQEVATFSPSETSNPQLARRPGLGRRPGRAPVAGYVHARALCRSAVVSVIRRGKAEGWAWKQEAVASMQLRQTLKRRIRRRTLQRTPPRLRAVCCLVPEMR